MDRKEPVVTAVYRNRLLDWFWAIFLPFGIYLLASTVLASFGILLPGTSKLVLGTHWSTSLFAAVMLVLWVRYLRGIFRSITTTPRPEVLVSDHDIEFPGGWKLRWDEIERAKNLFGYVTFYPKDPDLGHVTIFPAFASFRQWSAAKARMKRNAPKEIARAL